jgi:hypothetical protein
VFSRCNVKITKEDFFLNVFRMAFSETFWPNKKVTKYLVCKDNTVLLWLKDFLTDWLLKRAFILCQNYWTSYLYLWNKRDQTYLMLLKLKKKNIFLVKIPKLVTLPLKIYIETLLLILHLNSFNFLPVFYLHFE